MPWPNGDKCWSAKTLGQEGAGPGQEPSLVQLAPGFRPLALLLILNEDVVKSRAGRGMNFCVPPTVKVPR